LRASDAVKSVALHDLRDKLNEGGQRVALLVDRLKQIAGTKSSAAVDASAQHRHEVLLAARVRGVIDATHELAASITKNLESVETLERLVPSDPQARTMQDQFGSAAALAIHVAGRVRALDAAAKSAHLGSDGSAAPPSPALQALQTRFGMSPTIDMALAETIALPNLSATMARALTALASRESRYLTSIDTVTANVRGVIAGGQTGRPVLDELSRVAFVARDRTEGARRSLAQARQMAVFQPDAGIDVAAAQEVADGAILLEREVIAQLAQLGITTAVAVDLAARDQSLAKIEPRRRTPMWAKFMSGESSDAAQAAILALIAEAKAAAARRRS
jgi:hypothetical protein